MLQQHRTTYTLYTRKDTTLSRLLCFITVIVDYMCFTIMFCSQGRGPLCGPNIVSISSRKHAYSNILQILPPKNENFQIKHSDIFHISAQKHRLRVPVRTASIYFFSRNKKNNVYPSKPQFYYIKVGFKGVKTASEFVVRFRVN